MGVRKERRKQLRRKRARIFFYTFSTVLLLAVFGTCIYGYYLLCTIRYTDIKIEPPLPHSFSRNGENAASAVEIPMPGEAINIALLGIDREEDEVGRTDTIIIVSIDKYDKKVRLASLMRDMYVDIPGIGGDRINAAYAYGGPELALGTINSNFNLDIKYYVAVDFKGVEMLIDSLGGTDVYVKEGELPHVYWDYSQKYPGLQHLNGKETLNYMRIRRFGNADFERTERQRRVIMLLFDKVKKQGVNKFPGLVSSALQHMETNMSRQGILEYGMLCLNFGPDVEQIRLPIDGMFNDRYIRGMAVLLPDMKSNTEKLHEFLYPKGKLSF